MNNQFKYNYTSSNQIYTRKKDGAYLIKIYKK